MNFDCTMSTKRVIELKKRDNHQTISRSSQQSENSHGDGQYTKGIGSARCSKG